VSSSPELGLISWQDLYYCGWLPILEAWSLDAQIIVALVSSLLGGTSVAVIAQLSTRSRTRAEVRKIDAETDRTRAETAKILIDMPGSPVQESPGGRPLLGWFVAGSDPDDYQVGTDTDVAHSGNRSGFIASTPRPRGFGTLMQTFRAERFLDTRLRLSAYIRVEAVERWAGLWMRVDGPDAQTLAFDNMQDRPISGTLDWRMYQIVLDVPPDAEAIAFGVLLEGPGRVWLDDMAFAAVDGDVPTTGVRPLPVPLNPVNLDFSAGPDD